MKEFRCVKRQKLRIAVTCLIEIAGAEQNLSTLKRLFMASGGGSLLDFADTITERVRQQQAAE